MRGHSSGRKTVIDAKEPPINRGTPADTEGVLRGNDSEHAIPSDRTAARHLPSTKVLLLRPYDNPVRNGVSFVNPLHITFAQSDAESPFLFSDFLEHASDPPLGVSSAKGTKTIEQSVLVRAAEEKDALVGSYPPGADGAIRCEAQPSGPRELLVARE
jgi:hypothetical protein